MKTIAVTGASGRLGGELIKKIMTQTDWNVIAFASREISFDPSYSNRIVLCNNKDIEHVLCNSQADILVHFAFARRFRSNNDIATSLDFSAQVYHAVFKTSHCRVINISTVGVYAASDDFINEQAPIGPDSLYGMAKYASEVLLRAAFEEEPSRYTNLRLSGIAQSQRILPIFIDNAMRKHEINITGGEQQFSWLDEVDAINAVFSALKIEEWQPVYNISLDKSRYSIMQLAKMVAMNKKVQAKGEVKINLTPQDVHLCVGWDSSAFIMDSGWQPIVPIKDTIDKMVDAWLTEFEV